MNEKELKKVERTFYSKQGELSVKEKLSRSKDFYYWLQKQKPKEVNEDTFQERQSILNVEYRLYWHILKVAFESEKEGEKIKFKELADNWDTTLAKYLYEFIGWYWANVTKKGGLMAVSNEVQQSYISSMEKLVRAAEQADFYQMMYIYMQLERNEMMDFKGLAYPPKKEEKKQASSSDELFLGPDRELFKSEEEQPVFWHSIAEKYVSIQDCIDENLNMRFLCWPPGIKGHQAFIFVLPPMHYENAKGCGINWENTYKGATLRSINEKIIERLPKEEIKNMDKKECEAALDNIDVSWLVGEDERRHPKVAKQR